MAEAGLPVVFLRMMESPGNYLVVIRRSEKGPDKLELPCTYTGRVISASGTYQHATLTWDQDGTESTLPESHWVHLGKTFIDKL